MSENIGVALVTTGPGSTNAITGLLGAWIESVPLIIISGQVKTSDINKKVNLRQQGVQGAEILKIVKSITKFSVSFTKKTNFKKILNNSLILSLLIVSDLNINLQFNGSLRNVQLNIVNKYLTHLKHHIENGDGCAGGLLDLYCGFGKTFIALYIICQLKLKAIIVTPLSPHTLSLSCLLYTSPSPRDRG